jgi:hypothetical protein
LQERRILMPENEVQDGRPNAQEHQKLEEIDEDFFHGALDG